MTSKTKILLVDDHPLVREWLDNLLSEEPDLEVCGRAGSNREALALIDELRPQVVVVDITMEGGSGLELIKNVKLLHPKTELLVLSMHDEQQYAERAMRAGAAGYVMKSEATDKVLAGIRAVAQGGLYFSNAVNAMIAHKHVRGGGRQAAAPEMLSDRELEIYELLGRGHNPRQIAAELSVGFKTVHTYCGRIRDKLNLTNMNELIFHAVRWHESQQPR